jgi:hypothetical protein|tara:strand:- start:44 stop:247 length:204 start_codon:yes stop_codon:yes gene_type:complete
MEIFIAQAILEINSNAKVRVKNNNIDNVDWLEGTAEISKSDIEAKVTEMKADPKPEWIVPEREMEKS